MTKPLLPRWAAPVSQRPFCAGRQHPPLAAALLEQQVVSVRCPGMQHAVLPVGARTHQFLAVRHPGHLEYLFRLIQITHAELPGQHPIRTRWRETLVPFDAELNRAVAKGEEIRVLGSLVRDAEPEEEVEIPLSAKIADKENRDDPPKQRCHSAT